MMEIATASIVFEKLLKVIGLVKQGEIERDEKTDRALRNTHKALVETKGYIRIIKVQDRDIDKENQIAGLWYEASIDMRHIDEELAQICNLKGGYWCDPEAWEELQGNQHDISIGNVESQLYELLSK